MISWIQIWPLLLVPYVLLCSVGVVPALDLFGHHIGGPWVREWFLNHLALPVLPSDAGWALVEWFSHASTAQEIGLHALISLNVYAVVFPLVYLVGFFIIRLSAWSASVDLEQKRQSLKRKGV